MNYIEQNADRKKTYSTKMVMTIVLIPELYSHKNRLCSNFVILCTRRIINQLKINAWSFYFLILKKLQNSFLQGKKIKKEHEEAN